MQRGEGELFFSQGFLTTKRINLKCSTLSWDRQHHRFVHWDKAFWVILFSSQDLLPWGQSVDCDNSVGAEATAPCDVWNKKLSHSLLGTDGEEKRYVRSAAFHKRVEIYSGSSETIILLSGTATDYAVANCTYAYLSYSDCQHVLHNWDFPSEIVSNLDMPFLDGRCFTGVLVVRSDAL